MPTIPHRQERSHQAAHHGVAERIGLHGHHDMVTIAAPVQRLDLADRRCCLALLAVSSEVVFPDERSSGFIHPIDIEGGIPLEHPMPFERIEDAIADGVGVAAPDRREAGIEIIIDLGQCGDANIVGQCPIDPSDGEFTEFGHVNVGNLPPRVHPGVGSPRADNLNLGVHQVAEHPLKFTLDSAQPMLASPAVEIAAVVGQIEAEPQA